MRYALLQSARRFATMCHFTIVPTRPVQSRPRLARFAGLADWYDAATTLKPHTERIISATEALEYLYEQRDVLLNARLMGVQGELQREGKVIHVIARKLLDHSELLGDLVTRSRNFR